jgi:uncharacterized protein (TIGR02266 family)
VTDIEDEETEHNRVNKRVSVKLAVGYKTVGSFITDYVLNISKGGLFVTAKEPLPPGTFVELIFSLPNCPLPFRLTGVVHWTNMPGSPGKTVSGMGIKFTTLTDMMRRRIERFIKAAQEQPGPLKSQLIRRD